MCPGKYSVSHLAVLLQVQKHEKRIKQVLPTRRMKMERVSARDFTPGFNLPWNSNNKDQTRKLGVFFQRAEKDFLF